jgi:hypothetical protein
VGRGREFRALAATEFRGAWTKREAVMLSRGPAASRNRAGMTARCDVAVAA